MPIVSIIVATYNSSPFIIETLESISKQTWKEIELIITDDCSKDDTVEICRNWLDKNKERLISGKIITSEINTGVSANANRGLKAAEGEWIKLLGADDTLKQDCIENNMRFVETNSDVKVLFSQVEIYKDTFKPENLIETTPALPYNPNGILGADMSAASQYKMLLLSDRIHFSPGVFINRETLLSLGGFDESLKLQEDYPLWLNLTKNGHKLYFMDKITVNYRRHLKALNNTGIDYLINPNYYKGEKFRRVHTYPYLPADVRLNQRYIWIISQLFRGMWINKNTKLNRFLMYLISIYINPFKYFIWCRKQINKDLNKNEFYA